MKQLLLTHASLTKISLCTFLLSSPSYGMHRLRMAPTCTKKAVLASTLARSVGSRAIFSHNSNGYDPDTGREAYFALDRLDSRIIHFIGGGESMKELQKQVHEGLNQCKKRSKLADEYHLFSKGYHACFGTTQVLIDGKWWNKRSIEETLRANDAYLIDLNRSLWQTFAVIEAAEEIRKKR